MTVRYARMRVLGDGSLAMHAVTRIALAAGLILLALDVLLALVALIGLVLAILVAHRNSLSA